MSRKEALRAAHPTLAALADLYRDGITGMAVYDVDGNLVAGKPLDAAVPPGCAWVDAEKIGALVEHDRLASQKGRR